MRSTLLGLALMTGPTLYAQTAAPAAEAGGADTGTPAATETEETPETDVQPEANQAPTGEENDPIEVEEKIQEPDEHSSASPHTYPAEQREAEYEEFLPDGRKDKIGGVAFRWGLFVGLIPGSGFEGFYHINKDIQLGLAMYQGKLDLRDKLTPTTGASSDKLEIAAKLNLVQGRYFFGNSFYTGAAVGQRIVNTDFELKSTSVDAKIVGKVEAKSTILGVTVGNLWTWDSGLFFGVDWFGYMIPVSSEETSSATPSGTSEPTTSLQSLKSDTDDLAKQIGKLSTPFLLVFNFGFSF